MRPVIGADISYYQNNIESSARINFAKMKTLAEFVIIRAGQNSWMDRDIKINWEDAKQANIPRGSYWYYDSRANPKQQADLWVKALNGDLGELPLFLDLEENYDGGYTSWRNWVVFLEHLKTLVGKKEICIYTGYYYFVEHAPRRTSKPKELEYFHQYPLWIANYRLSVPRIPQPWDENEWLLWQYTAKGDGFAYGAESKGIDLNIYNGSLADFRKRFNLPEPVTIPAPAQPTAELPAP